MLRSRPSRLVALLLAALIALSLSGCGTPSGLELRVTNEWRRPVVVAVHEGQSAPPRDLLITGQQVVAPGSTETFRPRVPNGPYTLSVDGEPVAEFAGATNRVVSIRVTEDLQVEVDELADG